ncbi:hypothetical protein R6V09_23830 [Streptomyces sp. W16]|uniref:hypothetical protein n=1 Tax=Streptomyces sp. W16 TaxID=3076631 RepID=UPI00295BB3DD|nr:hypothetical protein [Streptomyces sp. W16]MDV9173134.1 hypothetical protein [Streptomyces sp. W16]
MSDWTTALVAAAAALSGSAVTGYFGVLAARRQADAAREGAQRQADAAWNAALRQADVAWNSVLKQAEAQLEVMRETLRAQAAAAQRGVRRTAYVGFLGRTDQARRAVLAWAATPTSTALRDVRDAALLAVDEALNVLRLEGPDEVIAEAEAIASALPDPSQAYQCAHADFLARARSELSPDP